MAQLEGTECDVSPREMLQTDVIRLAQASSTLKEFEELVLTRLQAAIGFEAAMMDLHRRDAVSSIRTQVGIAQCELLSNHLERREHKLEIERLCGASAGIFVTIDGKALSTSRMMGSHYFREIMAAANGTHCLWGLPQLRGALSGEVILIRRRNAFGVHEQRHFSQLLPLLALCATSFHETRSAEDNNGSAASAESIRLSQREREILTYLQMGYTNIEIALACGLSPNTVRNQLVRIFRKIGASTRAEAVGISLRYREQLR